MAHAAPTAPRRHRQMAAPDMKHLSRSAFTGPLLLGLVYGVWAAFIKRQTGPVDAGNVFYGILCGFLFAACLFALARVGPMLAREAHATAYGVFAGIAAGYLHSLTNQSVLRATTVGLAVGVGVGLLAFYRYYTHED
ncbi:MULTISPECIES: hypothetical protein [unclassified Streptomyces]|uniref:hypothetical protein n=1 Tax=unclassified Streptomyces TaxID=2593676 RepID=UPI001BE9DB87|nr:MULTISPECIES: hypothetical protein [unclassified Streptomyces]MBT2407967.1 hypothetical protein [Streptomyces sp. ISL-21]MBT2457665.1 hypothetical protein [Streptomyces sp. ISL-86]MBT2610538.1 hypothetical protein [Streptomyces sp. ISL-87]